MPWKTMDVREQRPQFVVAAARREKSFTALCAEFGVSHPTGCLWLERYRQQGIAGIAERSGTRLRRPGQTAAGLETEAVNARQRFPDRGARKLKVYLNERGVALTRQHDPPHFVAP